MRKPGCIEPVVYFRYPDGHVNLAPYTSFPTPDNAIREEADTLNKVDELLVILQRQELERGEREMEAEEDRFAPGRQSVRDRIYARITSGQTTEYEKEFLKLYLQLRDDRKRQRYQQRLLEYHMYLYARENDLGSRRADTEEFHPDRIQVKS